MSFPAGGGNPEYETTALRERRGKYVVLSFVLTQKNKKMRLMKIMGELRKKILFASFFDCTKKEAERNAGEIEMCYHKVELRSMMGTNLS
jgi:hypothetical protein